MTPEQILHYKIERKIGQGGMGEVFLATDTKLGRKVALKFLPESLSANAESRERLLREAQAASKLIHPNIVTVYSIESEDNRDFIVMEYVSGLMLGEYFSEKDRGLDEVLSISIQLAEALQKAHEAGVIHRDLKPGNILMDADNRPRILDFGLAKIVGAAKLTKTGSTMGTMEYISPELAQGKDVDPRSDIFSFGVLLYEMITGRVPFTGDHEAALIYAIVNDEPEPMARFKSGISDELQHIVTKCLAKLPEERYQSVSEIAADLKRQVRVSQTPSPTQASIDSATRSKSSIFGWAIAALLVLSAAWYFGPIGPGSTTRGSPTGPIKLAVLPFENLGAPDDEYFADGITEEIIARLASVSGLGVIARTSIMSYKGTEKQVQVIAEELGVDYILEGTIRWQKSTDGDDKVRITPQLVRASDGTHAWAHIYEESMSEVFQVQSDVAKQVVLALNVTLLEPERQRLAHHGTGNAEAYDFYLRGTEHFNLVESGLGEQALNLASRFYQSAIGQDPTFAAAHARLAQCYIELFWHNTNDPNDLALAEKHVDQALKLAPAEAEPLLARGSLYYHKHEYDASLRELNRALELQPTNAIILLNLGYLHRRMGNFELALQTFEKAVEFDPVSNQVLNATAVTANYLKDYSVAERLVRMAISVAPQIEVSYTNLAIILISRDGDVAGALSVFDDAENVARSSGVINERWAEHEYLDRQFDASIRRAGASKMMMDHPDRYHTLVALCYRALGDSAMAHAQFDSLSIHAAAVLDGGAQLSVPNSRLALAYAGLGDTARAYEFLATARQIFDNETNRWSLEYFAAATHMILGNHDEAIDRLQVMIIKPGPRSRHFLRLSPLWDPLREHPRFQALVADPDAT